MTLPILERCLGRGGKSLSHISVAHSSPFHVVLLGGEGDHMLAALFQAECEATRQVYQHLFS